jgi:hypothetical protein
LIEQFFWCSPNGWFAVDVEMPLEDFIVEVFKGEEVNVAFTAENSGR